MSRRVKEAPPPVNGRMVYADRWAQMTPAEREQVADGHVAEIDDLARRIPKMSEFDLAVLIAQQYGLLDAQVARIEAMRDHLSRLVAERNLVFVRLALAGEPQGRIGRRAKVKSTMVVAFSIGSSQKSGKASA